MRSGTSLAISENSEVALDLAEPTTVAEKVDLHHGAVNVQNPSHQPEVVTVGGASVLVESDGGFPAICRIAMVGASSAIINDRGHVEVRGAGAPLILPMGKYVTLEEGMPQGGSTAAGSVAAEIPAETIQHGAAPAAPLKVQDAVFWGDTVQTQNTGRVRIALKDGSTLNVGARSTMKIVQHDAASQQTAIELTAGKLRSQVQKIDQQAHPNGKFEVTTQTAVIGVVGTEFVVEAVPNQDKKKRRTLVWCIEGTVRVRNLDAAVVGLVLLTAGQFTMVADGLAPSAAAPASGNIQVNQTSINGTHPGTSGWGGHGITRIVAMGASATGATVSGVAISDADTTSSDLQGVGNTLKGVITTLNGANNDSNNAINSANNANQSSGNSGGILQGILQEYASPTYPCGCH
jgi:ferric-dicitrate binding protein FerR (iron transport regulator)